MLCKFFRHLPHYFVPWFVFLFIMTFLAADNAHGAWQPIIGIPEPPFGVNEITLSTPNPWSSGTEGFYYVDPASAIATDTNNPYGYPTKPRSTIPNPIPAGAVVEIHGQLNSNITINAQGTSSNPVFVRGKSYVDRPTFGLTVKVSGSYLIIENIKTEPKDSSVGSGNSGIYVIEGSNNIAIRHCEISGVGNLNKTGSIGIGTWTYAGIDVARYILLDDLYIHDLGDINTTVDQDAHGVVINGNAENVWVVNSTMTLVTGDGVQIEAQHSRGREHINHIYLGNNIVHQNKQSGLWIKHAQDVIVSQNTIYDMSRSPSSPGACLGYQYSGDFFWFLHNTLYNCYQGIKAQSGDIGEQTDVYYIGNLIFNINSDQPTNPHESGGISLRMGSTNHYIINNTIYNADSGINAPISSGKLIISNNIIAERNETTMREVYIEGAATNSIMQNNLFYNSGGLKFFWNWSIFTDLSLFESTVQAVKINKNGDPFFIDKTNNNFNIYTNSPAKDAGAINDAYTTFFNRYGIDIAKDIVGVARPQGSAWDIGAYEYLSIPDTTPPAAPTGLAVN